MGFLSQEEALASISRREQMHNGNVYEIYEAYLGIDDYTAKPKRISGRSEVKVRAKIADFYRRVKRGGSVSTQLTPYQVVDAKNAIAILKEHGSRDSLSECIRKYFAEHVEKAVCRMSIGEAYRSYESAQAGKSVSHVKAVRDRVGSFVESFGPSRMLSEVTARNAVDDIRGRMYDPSRPETKSSYNGHLEYVKTFMRWCCHPVQGYLEKSPLDMVEKLAVEWKDPEFAHAAAVRALFAVLQMHVKDHPEDLAYAILSFFCGMRTSEIERVYLGPSAVTIDLDERFIRIVKVKGATKGIGPRSFTIPDTAYAWMRSFDFMSAVMKSNTKFRNHIVARAHEAKVKIPRNAGRHTFITMYSAAFKNQVELTKIVGNSEDVRAAHYDGLSSEKEGREYFAITPCPAAS